MAAVGEQAGTPSLLVDGYQLPKQLGGHPALDFCNTWAGWTSSNPDPRAEYLQDFDRLAVWTGYVGLADPVAVRRLRQRGLSHPDAAERALHSVRELRAAVYPVLLGQAPSTQQLDLAAATATFAGFADRAAAASHLESTEDGLLVRRVDPTQPEDCVHLIALCVEGLAVSDRRATVRACPGPDCGWLFLDPRGRRRWCSMASCGNRAKVRAFDARQREASSS